MRNHSLGCTDCKWQRPHNLDCFVVRLIFFYYRDKTYFYRIPMNQNEIKRRKISYVEIYIINHNYREKRKKVFKIGHYILTQIAYFSFKNNVYYRSKMSLSC